MGLLKATLSVMLSESAQVQLTNHVVVGAARTDLDNSVTSSPSRLYGAFTGSDDLRTRGFSSPNAQIPSLTDGIGGFFIFFNDGNFRLVTLKYSLPFNANF